MSTFSTSLGHSLLVKLVICFFRHPILRSTPLSWKKSVDCLLPPYGTDPPRKLLFSSRTDAGLDAGLDAEGIRSTRLNWGCERDDIYNNNTEPPDTAWETQKCLIFGLRRSFFGSIRGRETRRADGIVIRRREGRHARVADDDGDDDDDGCRGIIYVRPYLKCVILRCDSNIEMV